MKKINLKKVLATVAALSVVGCVAAIPASAATSVDVTIDSKEVDIKDIATPVNLYVASKECDTGVNAFEFGIDVDNRIPTYTIINNSKTAMQTGGDLLDIKMTMETSGGDKYFTWLTYADKDVLTDAMNLVLVNLTLPSDAKVGDVYKVSYVASRNKEAFWRNEDAGLSYTCAGATGTITIIGETEPPTEPTEPETDPITTEPETDPITTEPDTTEAVLPTDNTEPTGDTGDNIDDTNETGATGDTGDNAGDTNDSTEPSTEKTTDGSTPSGTSGGSSSSSTGSPNTGSSDVLPIAGAAAAVAVLGGVALVSKKKND